MRKNTLVLIFALCGPVCFAQLNKAPVDHPANQALINAGATEQERAEKTEMNAVFVALAGGMTAAIMSVNDPEIAQDVAMGTTACFFGLAWKVGAHERRGGFKLHQ